MGACLHMYVGKRSGVPLCGWKAAFSREAFFSFFPDCLPLGLTGLVTSHQALWLAVQG